MRTVLYTLLGCECRVSVVKFCFLPTRKGEGGYHQSKNEEGCERTGGHFGKQLRNAWATGPQLPQKSCKKAVKFNISRLFVVDSKGFEPSTSRMRKVIWTFFAWFPMIYSGFRSVSLSFHHSLELKSPCGTPPSVVGSVVKNAPCPLPETVSRLGRGAFFMSLTACIVTLREVLSKSFSTVYASEIGGL